MSIIDCIGRGSNNNYFYVVTLNGRNTADFQPFSIIISLSLFHKTLKMACNLQIYVSHTTIPNGLIFFLNCSLFIFRSLGIVQKSIFLLKVGQPNHIQKHFNLQIPQINPRRFEIFPIFLLFVFGFIGILKKMIFFSQVKSSMFPESQQNYNFPFMKHVWSFVLEF